MTYLWWQRSGIFVLNSDSAIDTQPQVNMTDLESDQEREVFFRTTESTEHQDAVSPQHQIEPQRLDNSTLARSSRSPVDERRENEVNQDSSPIWMRSAVKDMIDMQSQMSQALQGVTSLLTRLCQKDSNLQQERNNNNFSNTDRGQGEFHSRCRNRSQIDDRHSETDYDDRHTYSRSPPRSSERSRSDRRSHQCNVKLPAFTGKDEWKVWITDSKLSQRDTIGMMNKNWIICCQNWRVVQVNLCIHS